MNLTGCKLYSNSTTNSLLLANTDTDPDPTTTKSRLLLGTPTSTVIWPAAWTNNGCISWTGTNQMSVGSLTVATNAILTHEATSPNNKININLTGNLTIDPGGAIWVSERGASTLGQAGAGSRCGGGYGGQGGFGSSGNAGTVGTTYDSVTNPVIGGSLSAGGKAGGGVVIIRVTGAITNNGNIVAKGQGTSNDGGGGSGGAVNLLGSSFGGNGNVNVDGGPFIGPNDTGRDAPGGGGRIAIVVTNSAGFGSVALTANGGARNTFAQTAAAAGTIYLRDTNSIFGKLIVPASDATSTFTLIGPLVDNGVVTMGDVELRSGSRLAVSNTCTLQVYGNWSNASANAVGGGGNVELKGTTTNTLYGSTVFPGFVCTNAPGKTLLFQVNTTNTMLTALNIAGASGNPVSLLPASAGRWSIKATNTMSPTYSISYVVVSNSTAVTNASGQTLTANFSTLADVSADNTLNSNTNWLFPASGLAKVWNGSAGTSWGTDANWTPSGVPGAGDLSITIPSGGNQPVLDSDRTYSCPVIIFNGATLNLGGGVRTLTLNGALTNMGTIIATAGETLSCSKDVDFTGGSFTPALATLKLNAAAAGSQTFKPGNCTFYRIEVPNAATVTVQSAGFTASQFSCRAPGATLNFNAGSTYTITDLDLRGSSSGATTNFVTLRSTSTPTKWNLNVTRAQTVRYVDAQDSDADGGLTIYAVNSVGAVQNNDNWNFGSGKAWAGGTSTDWANANNWSPSGVPGATDFVLIDGYYANAPTLGANTTNAGLAVGGYASNAVLTLNATLTVDGNAVVQPTYGKIKFTTDTAGGALTVNSNLTVLGTIECQRSSAAGNGAGRVISVGGNLLVDASGLISAKGMGFATGGPGGPSTGGANNRAGSHGGEPNGESYNTVWPPTYGSITQPTSLGSQGYSAVPDNSGGGAIRLNVVGLATIAAGGSINAESSDNTGGGLTGSAAGGSVWLTTGTLGGSGTISAKAGDSNGSGGGGGRIAIVVTNGPYTDSLTVKAYGAAASLGNAAAGTVYVKASNTTADGQLISDNNNLTPYVHPTTGLPRTRIGASVTEKTVGDVILRNAGRMAVSAGETLTVNGSWSNAVATNAISGGTVAFAGTNPNPVTVWGGNTWSNLTISALGKTVNFEANKTQFVYGVAFLTNSVTLQSTAPGTWWYLRQRPGGVGTQDVGVVTVQDSNATNGWTFRAAKGSTDKLGNVNWIFLKPTGSLFMLR
ncbi:MAG: hypothetical protein FJ388_07970 [Verrucomicrobia bacterium]|nr:hypothetical protein [Verrucomicrobiota bacterium]